MSAHGETSAVSGQRQDPFLAVGGCSSPGRSGATPAWLPPDHQPNHRHERRRARGCAKRRTFSRYTLSLTNQRATPQPSRSPTGGGLFLHWHRPSGPGGCATPGGGGVQCPLCQHPFGSRVGAGRDHHADARHPRAQCCRPSGRVVEGRQRRPRSARQDPGHCWLWPYWLATRHSGRRPRHARGLP